MLNNQNYDKRPLHFGFTLSIVRFNYQIDHSGALLSDNDTIFGVETSPMTGFGLGLLADVKLNRYLNLRIEPGLQMGDRKLLFRTKDQKNPNLYLFHEYENPVPTIYVDFPVLLKLRAKRINNYRPYLIAGASLKYDYESRRENQKASDYSIRVEPYQFYYELGFGIDYYMPFFKFSTELKFCQGLNDILVHDETEYTAAMDRLLSKLIVFSLHFE